MIFTNSLNPFDLKSFSWLSFWNRAREQIPRDCPSGESSNPQNTGTGELDFRDL
jgi:hypothetical protein